MQYLGADVIPLCNHKSQTLYLGHLSCIKVEVTILATIYAIYNTKIKKVSQLVYFVTLDSKLIFAAD